MSYITAIKNQLLVTLFVIAPLCFVVGQDTYADNFGSVSYSNNDGNQNWSTDWIEQNDVNSGPTATYVGITGGELYFNWIFRNFENIRRTADISGATSATLSFDWRTVGLDTNGVNVEQLNIQISTNGTAYTTIGTFTGTNNGSFSLDISAYISATTTIRFISTGPNWEFNEYAYIDNVLISATTPSSQDIAIDDVTVDEADGTATFTVSHTGVDAPGSFTIDYATANNTANAGVEYTNTSGTLNFSGTSGEDQTFTVPILDDNFVETSPKTFFVNLSNPSLGSINISDAQGLGTIDDDDPAAIAINNVTVDEDAGTLTFTVTLTGGDVSGGFTVNYATANNSAVDPNDFIDTSGTLTFAGTENEQETFTVTIVDDPDIEGTQNFFANLSGISNSLVTIADSQGVGTINDNDVEYNINGTSDTTCSGTFVDNGGSAGNYGNGELFFYTLCPDTPGTFVALDFTSFDVEAGFDFLRIYDDNAFTDLIDIYDNNNVPECVAASNASGCLTLIFTSDGSVTGSGWQATISCLTSYIEINDITVNETDGTADFTVTHVGVTPGGFTVDYSTQDNTAFADSDFVSSTGTIAFSGTNGETQTINIPLINNNFIEYTESFFVNLSNSSSGTLAIKDAIGEGTIIDEAADTPVVDDVPLTLFDEFNGLYDYALTAGTLRTADEGVDPCAITNSSSNTLTTTIPAGSTIEKAYLIWGHSGFHADDVVTFEGQSVTATVQNSSGGTGFRGMVSDVTTIIQSIPDPSTNVYDFGDMVIDNDIFCPGTTVFGGWSLFIFYSNPTLPAVSINMYNGFDTEASSTTSYTLDGFFAIGSAGSKTSVLSWEGDPTRTGNETISVTTSAGTTTLTGDGDNSPTLENVFNSTIYDDTAVPIFEDTSLFGFDLDTYDISSLITQGETTATTNIETGGDLVVLNSVLLKVPSNLITGTVYEDVNYPGGAGRDMVSASGIGVENVTVELYDSTGTLEDTTITDASGDYSFGGMANGDYSVRVVNNSVRSNRGGGAACTTCLPLQTFRRSYSTVTNTTTDFTDEIGGADPTATDVGTGTLTGAQSVSSVSIENEGIVTIDFGFNFNTIVNTNDDGQGSLGQFIINSNNLDETGLDIEANSIFDPAAGEDTTIFMIPTDSDPLGRTVDPGYIAADGYFDIAQNPNALDDITDDNTHIDGRTQTAYSGDTNAGTIGSGGGNVGISANALPDYNLPEIQVWSTAGDVIQIQASNTVIRNIAVFGGNNRSIRQDSGTNNLITANLLGVNALGVKGLPSAVYVDDGVQVLAGTSTIDGNYISENTDFGVFVNGGTSTIIQNNHFTNNGFRGCEYNIGIQSGSGIVIQNNLIENAASNGIDESAGNVTITENTITISGADAGCPENAGIRLEDNNSLITNNIINNNGGAGIVLTGGNTSGNLISQNSIFANGTTADALGIDIDSGGAGAVDGVTINDTGDGDNGPNTSINFPVFESASIRGTTLKLVGWSRPGATIEFFITDINQGTAAVGDNQLGLTQDYGEGQTYIGSAVEGSGADADSSSSAYSDADGNNDNTNRFNFSLTLGATIPVGTIITATATISNSTSEFANTFPIGASNLITNRRITYRVSSSTLAPRPGPGGRKLQNPNGVVSRDIVIDKFVDGQNGPNDPFQLQVRNVSDTAKNYKIVLENVPYANITGLDLNNHSLSTVNNGDGTYNHTFVSIRKINAKQTAKISGTKAPSPSGTGAACGCTRFYKQ